MHADCTHTHHHYTFKSRPSLYLLKNWRFLRIHITKHLQFELVSILKRIWTDLKCELFSDTTRENKKWFHFIIHKWIIFTKKSFFHFDLLGFGQLEQLNSEIIQPSPYLLISKSLISCSLLDTYAKRENLPKLVEYVLISRHDYIDANPLSKWNLKQAKTHITFVHYETWK